MNKKLIALLVALSIGGSAFADFKGFFGFGEEKSYKNMAFRAAPAVVGGVSGAAVAYYASQNSDQVTEAFKAWLTLDTETLSKLSEVNKGVVIATGALVGAGVVATMGAAYDLISYFIGGGSGPMSHIKKIEGFSKKIEELNKNIEDKKARDKEIDVEITGLAGKVTSKELTQAEADTDKKTLNSEKRNLKKETDALTKDIVNVKKAWTNVLKDLDNELKTMKDDDRKNKTNSVDGFWKKVQKAKFTIDGATVYDRGDLKAK
jgi:hypothetical protein